MTLPKITLICSNFEFLSCFQAANLWYLNHAHPTNYNWTDWFIWYWNFLVSNSPNFYLNWIIYDFITRMFGSSVTTLFFFSFSVVPLCICVRILNFLWPTNHNLLRQLIFVSVAFSFIVIYYPSVLPWFYFLGHLECLTSYLFHLISALRSWLPFGKRRWSGRGFLPLKNYRSNMWLKAKSHYVFKDNEIFLSSKTYWIPLLDLLDLKHKISIGGSQGWN